MTVANTAVTTAGRPGITFAVDDVTPAREPLPECRAHEAARQTLGGEIERFNDYHITIMAKEGEG